MGLYDTGRVYHTTNAAMAERESFFASGRRRGAKRPPAEDAYNEEDDDDRAWAMIAEQVIPGFQSVKLIGDLPDSVSSVHVAEFVRLAHNLLELEIPLTHLATMDVISAIYDHRMLRLVRVASYGCDFGPLEAALVKYMFLHPDAVDRDQGRNGRTPLHLDMVDTNECRMMADGMRRADAVAQFVRDGKLPEMIVEMSGHPVDWRDSARALQVTVQPRPLATDVARAIVPHIIFGNGRLTGAAPGALVAFFERARSLRIAIFGGNYAVDAAVARAVLDSGVACNILRRNLDDRTQDAIIQWLSERDDIDEYRSKYMLLGDPVGLVAAAHIRRHQAANVP